MDKESGDDIDIEDLPITYGAVATDIASGQEVWLRTGSMLDSIRASISIPGIFTPYFCKVATTHWLFHSQTQSI